MNLIPKVILTTLIVLTISSGMIILPSYAATTIKGTKSNTSDKFITSGNNTGHIPAKSIALNTSRSNAKTQNPNTACQPVKAILTNSGYSVTVIAKVMADMNCS